MARVFISHAGADLDRAVEVYGWLCQDGHELFLDRDLGSGMEVGENWKQRIYQELRRADAVVCLVSRYFVASPVCSAEVGIADSLGCRLLPLHLEKNLEYPLLGLLEYVHYDADGLTARQRLLDVLRRVDVGGRTHWREGTSPFPGLEPFTAALSQTFFGRSREIRELASRVRSTAGGGLLAVVGPSGCGKSSLVRAGLLPLLEDDPGWMTTTPWLPGDDPLSTLACAITATANQLHLNWSLATVRERLNSDDGLRGLADDLLLAQPGTEGRRLLVTIDQAEELFTRTIEPGRVITLLREAMTGPVRVVVTLRSEFLDDLRDLPGLAAVFIEPYLLGPLNRDMLRLVIEEPARIAGLRIDPELVARMVSDTGSGEALPLLAFTLQQLADGLSRGDSLSTDRYTSLGGVHGALARHADTVLTTAVTCSGLTEQQIINGLVCLVTLDDTGRRACRRVHRATLPKQVQDAMDVFVDQRLLTTSDEHGPSIGVAHEALLTAWPPLDKAITERTVALHTARSVEQAAAEWINAGRAEHFLWEAERLTTALNTLGLPAGHPDPATSRTEPIVDLTSEARSFLTATREHIQVTEQRERRRRTRITSALSVLLTLVLVAVSIAVVQRNIADRQGATATARGLVIQAEAIRKDAPQLALRLGLAARHLDPSVQTSTSLVNTLVTSSYEGTLTGHFDSVGAAAFSSDRRTLATGSVDRTVILWDVSDPAERRPLGRPLTGHAGPVSGLAFSRDGRTLATSSADRTVQLWDTSDPTRPRRLGGPLTGHTDEVLRVAFSPDGYVLATGSADNTVTLWDTTDPARPRRLGEPLTGHTDPVQAVAFSPAERTLATGSADNTVILWDTSDPAEPRRLGEPLTAHTNQILDVAFSPDGHTMVTTSADNTAFLWDTTDPARPRRLGEPLIGHTNWVNTAAFSADGRMLATGSADRTVLLWDTSDPTRPHRVGDPLAGHTSFVNVVAFSPAGRTLATGSADDTVILWDTRDPLRARMLGRPLTGHTQYVNTLAFSPDGRTLATGSADQTVLLWDTGDPARPRRLGEPLTGHTDEVLNLAFSPDGRTLATGSADNTVILWGIRDPARPRRLGTPLTGHTGDVNTVTFSPDGRTLATGSADTTVILWDISDPVQPRRLGEPLSSHISDVNTVAFSPNGNTLATGAQDKTVILWDTSDPAQPSRRGDPLIGHTNVVQAAAFSPDGHTLATSSSDNTALLWDTSDPNQPRRLGDPLTGHTNWVNAVAFSSDGRILATGSGDTTVILRDLAPLNNARDHTVELACARAGSGLTPEEWSRYITGHDYEQTCPE
jgi:WD40 repeat protein